MNMLKRLPEQKARLRQFFPLVRNITWVAGCFSALVCIILAWSVWQFHTADPIQSVQLQTMIEQIQQGHADPAFIESVRAYDLMIRRAHFTALAFIHFGAHLLLGGLVVFVIFLKLTYELGRHDPKPGTFSPRQENPVKIRFLQTAVLLSALSLGLAGFLLPRWLSQPWQGQQDSVSISAPVPTLAEYQQQWPSFRGYQSLGLAYNQSPPIHWSTKTGKNILWSSELPKPGFNSPVIWSDRVLLSGADEQSREIFCFDINNGTLLWRKATTVSKSFPMPKVTDDTGLAAPSLAVDGRAVAAIFATGEILVTDMDGNPLWEKKLMLTENHYGHASSLLIHQNNLLVQYDSIKSGGRLYAFDLHTGKRRWQKKRDVDTSWASPILISTAEGEQLILTATPFVSAYDPQTGDQLWTVNDVISGEIGPSPAFDQGRLFFINQYSTLACVDAISHNVLWNVDRNLSDIPSPVARDGILIIPTSFGKVSCLSTADGKLLWEKRFEDGFNASPVVVGDNVYLLDIHGTMHIFKLAPDYQAVGAPALGEDCVATPAFANSQIIVRTKKQLIAIGVPTP